MGADVRPSTKRVLDALREGPKTTHQLGQPEVGGFRFGARLQEIREEGAVIACKRLRAGGYLYTLTRDVGGGAAHVPAPSASSDAANGPASEPDPITPADGVGRLFTPEPQNAALEDWEAA